MTPFQSLLIICNPIANLGRGIQVLEKLSDYLILHGFHHFFVYTTERPMDKAGIRQALETPHNAVVIIGGDGTLYDFLNSAENADQERIIYIPAGSGNDFARCLYGTLQSPDQYFPLVFHHQWTKVDCGSCNDKRFINGFGAGFDGYVASNAQRGIAGALKGESKYQLAVLQGIAFFSSTQLSLKVDGQVQFEGLAFMVSVGNGDQFGGGYQLAPGAKLNDQKLDVVVIPQINAWRRLLYLPKVKSGSHVKLPFVQQFQGSDIHLQYSEPVLAHIDGEVIESEQFGIKICNAPLCFAQFT